MFALKSCAYGFMFLSQLDCCRYVLYLVFYCWISQTPPCGTLAFASTSAPTRASGVVVVWINRGCHRILVLRAAAFVAFHVCMSACSIPMKNSTNGVFVNDIKILEQALAHYDIVQFGGAADILVGARFDGSGSHIRCLSLFVRWRHPAQGPDRKVTNAAGTF